MSDELRQVANGFKLRVKSYTGYDMNGYRFHTSRHEQLRPRRKTTNSQVFTQGTNSVEYYGIIEEIYELEYEGRVPLTPVIFKCRWFDSRQTRRTPHLGLVEIRHDSVYEGKDVYIVAQQAVQMYHAPSPWDLSSPSPLGLPPWHHRRWWLGALLDQAGGGRSGDLEAGSGSPQPDSSLWTPVAAGAEVAYWGWCL
jgi:hypothetical protein